MPSLVQSIEASYFLQMTEDEERVKGAVAGLFGKDLPEERQEAEGHFGNRIVWIRHHLTGEEAEAAVGSLILRMDAEDRKAILRDLADTLDEHNALYIRLNKQVLVMKGAAVLASADPIRVKVKPRAYLLKGDPAGFYARLLGAEG